MTSEGGAIKGGEERLTSEGGVVRTVSAPGVQLAGQTSPCSSTNLNALSRRSVSSTLRPTGRSFTVFWRRVPSGDMMNRPLGKQVCNHEPCC